MEEEKEEEMTTLDMKEIQNMAEELEVDQVYRSFCYTYKTAREQNLNEKELQKSKCKEYKWEEIITEKGRKQRESWILSNWKTKWSTDRNASKEKDTCSDKIEK